MSNVRRFDFDVTGCQVEDPLGGYVDHDDYAKLEAEAQALREEVARGEQHRNDQADLIVSLRTEVAALRARVVVPDDPFAILRTEFPLFDEIGLDEKEHCCEWNILHERKRLHRNLDELARLNGKAVSEGLLRRIVEEQPAVQDIGEMFNWQYARDQAMAELRALLGEGKES